MSQDFVSKILTSLRGRRIGLQSLSSAESGGSDGSVEYLVGPEGLRSHVNTAETTGSNVSAYGISNLPGTSAGSSSVYTIDPPVPGVRKTIRASTLAATYLKSNGGEFFQTTQNTSGSVIACSSAGGAFDLVGYTTAIWLGIGLTSGTSAKSGAFIVSTST